MSEIENVKIYPGSPKWDDEDLFDEKMLFGIAAGVAAAAVGYVVAEKTFPVIAEFTENLIEELFNK